MTKTKGAQTSIRDMDEADDVMREISKMTHRKAEVDNWVTEQEQDIRSKAKDRLLLDKKTEETVGDRISSLSADLLGFVELNKDLFATGKRSMELTHGTIGIRLGMQKVDVIGKITFKAIMGAEALLKKLASWGWISQKPTLDKEQIIADFKAAEAKTQTRLRQVSMTVRQEDEAWFETREAEIEAGSGRAAA